MTGPTVGRPGSKRLGALASACAVSTLVGGLGVLFLQPPADGSAHKAGPVTVLVEEGTLSRNLMARGRVVHADATNIAVPTVENQVAVVTDVVKSLGDEVAEGERILDVSGRPIVVLQGAIPMYRGLSMGDSGKDVLQLNAALARLGLLGVEPGDQFTGETAGAVEKLYANLGYSAPPPPEEALQRVAEAQAKVDSARDAVAENNVPVAKSSLLEAEEAVRQATESARTERSPATTAALGIAKERLRELRSRPLLTQSRERLQLAERQLASARAAAGTYLPLGSLSFAPTLPARVVTPPEPVGSVVDGPVATIASGTLGVQIRLSAQQRTQVKAGQKLSVTDGTGVALDGQVASVDAVPDASGESYLAAGLLEDVDADMAGDDVRVEIVVASMDHVGLHVPTAAVVTDADGRTWVEELGSEGQVERHEVRVGFAAAGAVEVAAFEGGLEAGDRIVVDAST